MRNIFRWICASFVGRPKQLEAVQAPDFRNTYKKKALSETALKEAVRDFPAAKVIWIIDGDTIVVAKGWSEIVIRLDSIDCPEDGQYWGDTAKYGLFKLIGGRKIRLEEYGLDPHGKTLATIFVQPKNRNEWTNVNERMVTLGHAWVMRRFYDHLPKDRKDRLNRLESWARSKRVGLWRASNPVPPWKWRSGAMLSSESASPTNEKIF